MLKRLQTRFLQVRILEELRADHFGQNRAKHGVCL